MALCIARSKLCRMYSHGCDPTSAIGQHWTTSNCGYYGSQNVMAETSMDTLKLQISRITNTYVRGGWFFGF